MVRKIGSIIINFDTLEWVHTGVDELSQEPLYTFQFISGKSYKVTANIPLTVEIEKALAEWLGQRFDPTDGNTVSIPVTKPFHFNR